MKLTNTLIALLTLVSFQLFAQIDAYNFSRKIEQPSDSWHKIDIPNDVFQHVNNELTDIRIYGINENQDTTEAPYLINISKEIPSQKNIEFKIINQSTNDLSSYFTFKLDSEEIIDHINLSFENQNFDWKANLEGSSDNMTWFSILEGYRILSIKNDQTDYAFTDLNFPASSYKYYRIHLSSKEAKLSHASVSKDNSKQAVYSSYTIQKSNQSVDQKLKTSVYEMTLDNKAPICKVNINIESPYDYYRPVTIKYITDSTKTQKGWVYSYKTLYTGSISSYEPNIFSFNSSIAKHLKIEIRNNDNSPLNIKNVDVEGYKHTITTRLEQNTSYYIAYGKEQSSKPNYDIKHIKIPSNLSYLNLGAEIITVRKVEIKQKPLFENIYWLWIILGIIVVLLGWFSMRMMTKK